MERIATRLYTIQEALSVRHSGHVHQNGCLQQNSITFTFQVQHSSTTVDQQPGHLWVQLYNLTFEWVNNIKRRNCIGQVTDYIPGNGIFSVLAITCASYRQLPGLNLASGQSKLTEISRVCPESIQPKTGGGGEILATFLSPESKRW
jgi:hypothetical protein